MAVLAVTPGPAVLFAIATGLQRGPRAALVGVAGMNAATIIWFVAAALGLGALVATFPAVFRVIALAGGLYLVWLGVRAAWAAWRTGAGLPAVRAARVGSAFRDGFAVQLANPKAILFYTAILPPFLDPARPMPTQIAAFAAATLMIEAAAMAAYALLGAALSARLADPTFRRVFASVVGVLLVGAGVMIIAPR